MNTIATYTTAEIIKNYVSDPSDHFAGTHFLGECRIPIYIEQVSYNEDTEALKALWIEFQDLDQYGRASNGQRTSRKLREWIPAYTIERMDIASDYSVTIHLSPRGKKMLADKLGEKNVAILKSIYKK